MEHSNINYDIVYNNYAWQIKSMKVGHIGRTGIKKIEKSVLLLVMIRGIDNGTFKMNRKECDTIAEIYNSRIAITNQPQNRAKEVVMLALAIWREGSFHLT